jgi:rod shape determining protein RodA
MYTFAYIPPNFLLRIALPLYVLGVLLLVCVALFGDIVNGARRWLHVGVTRIQPSEIMKIAVPLMLAWYFDRYEATLKLKNYLVATALLAVPVGRRATREQHRGARRDSSAMLRLVEPASSDEQRLTG